MMLAQFIHLQRFVHPIPLATHGHLDFRLPSRHDSCIRSSSLDLFPCPHRQPLLKAVSSIPFSLPLVLLIWLTFLNYDIGNHGYKDFHSFCRGRCQRHKKFWFLVGFFHSCIFWLSLSVSQNHQKLKILKKTNAR